MEGKEEKKEESVAEIEEVPDVSFKKDNVTFVIRRMKLDNAHRWAKWCEDWGLGKDHHTAFNLALGILEGKTKQILDLDSRITTIEKLLQTHDSLLENVLTEINKEPEEAPDVNALARQKASQRTEMLKKKREEEEKKKKEAIENANKRTNS